jgi:hypothetical protein
MQQAVAYYLLCKAAKPSVLHIFTAFISDAGIMDEGFHNKIDSAMYFEIYLYRGAKHYALL